MSAGWELDDSEKILSSDDEEEYFPSPALAAIDRARSMPKNLSVNPKAVQGERTLKRKSLLSRVAEFPDQSLERRDGRLFCGCCHEFISEKKAPFNVILRAQRSTQMR